jgi:hypothetical protein
MIRYALTCKDAHSFESWFQSASAFDSLKLSGMVSCPVCGSLEVEKAIMAPQVRPARTAAQPAAPAAPLSKPQNEMERQLARLKAKIEAESEYVGLGFATEARAIHDGDAPERPIYGEARIEDARALIEDGIAVAPLPFTPGRKTN